jgi:hypothetical protein
MNERELHVALRVAAVTYLQTSSCINHQVLQLEVPVHEVAVVQELHAVQQLVYVSAGRGEGQSSSSRRARRRESVHQAAAG